MPNELGTPAPMPHYLASRPAERLAAVRHDGTSPYLVRPDGKTQVTVCATRKPVEVTTIAVSTQHAAEIEDTGKIKADHRIRHHPGHGRREHAVGQRGHLCGTPPVALS